MLQLRRADQADGDQAGTAELDFVARAKGTSRANFYRYDWIRVLRRTREERASGPGVKPALAGAVFSLFLTGWLWRFRRALEQLYSDAVTSP